MSPHRGASPESTASSPSPPVGSPVAPPTGEIAVEIADTCDELRASCGEIRGLIDESDGVMFDQDPDIMVLRMEEPGRRRQPAVVMLRQEGRLICVAPLYVQHENLPLRISVLKLPSPRARILRLYGHDFIIAPGVERAVCYQRVLDAIRDGAVSADLIYLAEISEKSGLWQYLRAKDSSVTGWHQRTTTGKEQKLLEYEFGDSYEAWFKSLSKEARRLFRRKLKKLEKKLSGSSGGPGSAGDSLVTLRRYTDPDQVGEFLVHLDRVFPTTWQAKTFGTRPRDTSFDRELLGKAAERGWLRCYVLFAGDKPLSFLLGFQYGDVYEGAETGYDQSWNEFSPGYLLILESMKDLYKHDRPELIDWGFGEGAHKQRVSTAECPAYSLYLLRPSVWLALIELQRGLNVVYRHVRGLAERMEIDQQLRRWLKRKG